MSDSHQHLLGRMYIFDPTCLCTRCGEERKRIFEKHIGKPGASHKHAYLIERLEVIADRAKIDGRPEREEIIRSAIEVIKEET